MPEAKSSGPSIHSSIVGMPSLALKNVGQQQSQPSIGKISPRENRKEEFDDYLFNDNSIAPGANRQHSGMGHFPSNTGALKTNGQVSQRDLSADRAFLFANQDGNAQEKDYQSKFQQYKQNGG